MAPPPNRFGKIVLYNDTVKHLQRITGEPDLIKSRNMHFYLPPSFYETQYKTVSAVLHTTCLLLTTYFNFKTLFILILKK